LEEATDLCKTDYRMNDFGSIDNFSPSFFGSVVVSSSSLVMSKHISILKGEATTLSRNVGNRLPSDSESYLRRRETSATPLRKPKNSQS
jgi:hypothetical protein